MMQENRVYFLEGQNIGLRALEECDADGNYKNWFNDREVCNFNSHHRYPMTREELSDFIKGNRSSRTAVVLAVELKDVGAHIGNISLQGINYIDSSAEISFIMGEMEYWGKGYATEAARLLMGHAFMQLGLNRIYFGTSEENIGMQKIGEKLNFQREGIRRKAIFKNGAYHDIYEYGLLKEEWEGNANE